MGTDIRAATDAPPPRCSVEKVDALMGVGIEQLAGAPWRKSMGTGDALPLAGARPTRVAPPTTIYNEEGRSKESMRWRTWGSREWGYGHVYTR